MLAEQNGGEPYHEASLNDRENKNSFYGPFSPRSATDSSNRVLERDVVLFAENLGGS